MKRFLAIMTCIVVLFSLSACNKPIKNEDVKRDETKYVEYSGQVTNIIMYYHYMEITVSVKGEEKVFHLSNTKKIIDRSPTPKENPYIKEGVFVTVKCTEEESLTEKPRISYIIINSYDGIFLL
jgi:hypothetical protein